MIARYLQDAMVEDLTALFSRDSFPTPDGETAHPVAYAQNLPYRESDEADDPFPFILVRLDSGEVSPPTAHVINVVLIIGIYDSDPTNKGHRSVLEIIERIQAHYQEHPILGEFVMDISQPFRWSLQEEDSFPYYYGACNFVFHATAPRIVHTGEYV